MPRSKVTSKFQTTVPKELQQRLGTKSGDVLQGQAVGDHMRVTKTAPVSVEFRGTLKVGLGDPLDDVSTARESFVRQ
jgi:bifunctional DNA-binding transcriptional regulator/antitoxin component of YhaV-PrlF toxin-antitoxin module